MFVGSVGLNGYSVFLTVSDATVLLEDPKSEETYNLILMRKGLGQNKHLTKLSALCLGRIYTLENKVRGLTESEAR